MDLQADRKRKRTDEGKEENKRPTIAAHNNKKRTDEGKKERKRSRTAAVDETFQSKNVVASGSRKIRKVDLTNDNMCDRSTKASVHEAHNFPKTMQRLMSAVDGEIRPEELISLTDGTPKVEINETKCIEYLNKIHDKIVELKQKGLRKRRAKKRRKANWSELPNELLEAILKKLIPCEFDIVGFRHIRDFKAVCQSWRAAAKSCSSYVPLPRTQCLLLHGERENSYLFDPIGKKKHLIRNIHDYYPEAECVGSSYGWIVMFYKCDYLEESKAHLFNPITRAKIPIPSKLPDIMHRPIRAIISSNPSFNKNFVVVVQFGEKLAYYKHGDEDKSWKMLIEGVKGADYYGDKGFVFHDDLLVATARSFTNVWDFKEYPPLLRSSIKSSSKYTTFLMDSSLTGDILRLKKEWPNKTLKFGVEKLDLRESGKWESLQSLGDQSLILFGGECSVWQLISVTNLCISGCEKNCIYFPATELYLYAASDKYAIYDLVKGEVKSEGEEVMIKSFRIDANNEISSSYLWITPNPW